MRLITAVACTSLLFGGAAFAAGATGAGTENTAPHASTPAPSSSAAPPSAPASHTTTAAPEKTARTGHQTRSERVARREMCTRSANDKGLKGSARTKYLHSCHLEVVPR